VAPEPTTISSSKPRASNFIMEALLAGYQNPALFSNLPHAHPAIGDCWILDSRVTEQRLEAEVHVHLIVTVEKRQAGLIGH